MMTLNIPEAVFESGLLNREYHDRLLLDLPRWSREAGIPPRYVWSKLSEYCLGKDLEWVRAMRDGTTQGLIYTGAEFDMPVEDKMMAIAGCCLRNYMAARVMTVQEIVVLLKNDAMPHTSLILVPNFCMGKDDVDNLAPWQASALLGWLYSRLSRNLKTALYVGDMDHLALVYGKAMARHLRAHYTVVAT